MAYVPNSGSIVAFQGTVPFSVQGNIAGSVVAFQGGAPWANTNVGSVISVNQGSVATVIIGGSIAASFTPPANQSVSGTVQADVRGSVATVIIGGSIVASFTPPANQSISGTAGASVIGAVPVNVQSSVATVIIGGSIAASFTPPANQSVSGTVQTQVQASVAVVIIGGSVATATTNSSVFLLNSPNTIGSVIAYQGITPWVMVGSVYGAGSVVAFQGGTQITSIAGNVAVQGLNAPGASVTGNPVYTGGSDANGSIAAFKLGAGREQIITGSIQGTMSVLGTVPVTQSGAWSTSIIGGASVFQAGTWNVSVAGTANVSGSVVSFQGTAPWVIGSIVGTYAEDIPSAGADKGLFTLGIRNDTVASLVGNDLDYTGWSTDSAGRHLVKPFAADESRLDTVSSVVGTSVTALFSSVTGLRNYVTDVWVANTGAAATLVTFKDGSTSTLGFTIAPAGGGSNLVGLNFPMRTATAQDFTYVATTATSVLYVTAKGYKAP